MQLPQSSKFVYEIYTRDNYIPFVPFYLCCSHMKLSYNHNHHYYVHMDTY